MRLVYVQLHVMQKAVYMVHFHHLCSWQGTTKVLVERRTGTTEGFGKGLKVHMAFQQLLDELDQGSNSLYLTTQEVDNVCEHSLLRGFGNSGHCSTSIYLFCMDQSQQPKSHFGT